MPRKALVGKDKVAADSPEEQAKRAKRQGRFIESCMHASSSQGLVAAGGVGRCEVLEKEYLRLTSEPRATSVRPPRILQ
ncbi:uncharacterized protein HaLaN_32172, partial [Haematococcus lacustris]